MKLSKLQKEFANYLYNPKKNKILTIINKNKIPIKKLLQIYRNNVFGNFDSSMEMIYPLVKKLVGKNYFNNLIKIYHQLYRSPTGNLNDYGKYFPRLILNLRKEHKLFYLSDIAKLEWFYHRAYFSSDVPAIDIIKLQNLNPKDYHKLKFKLHPSCYLLASKYQLYTIWSQAKKNSEKKINIQQKFEEFILIERSNSKTNVFKLKEIEYLFLQKIKSANNIYQIYEIFNSKNQQFDIGSLINKYISLGVLSRFYLK